MLPTQGKSLLLAMALAVAAAIFGTPGPAAADRTIDAREFVILSDDIYKQMTDVEHAEGVSGGTVGGGSGLPAPDPGDGGTSGGDGGSGGGDGGPTGGSDSGGGPPPSSNGNGPGDNHSGLGDGTNPGQGGGSENSPNQGTDNPNNKKK